MISKFLASKFSGYAALIQAGLIVVAVLFVYWYGWSECKESQAIKDGEAAQRHVSNEVAISDDLQQKNRKVDEDNENEMDDLDIIRNAINRL